MRNAQRAKWRCGQPKVEKYLTWVMILMTSFSVCVFVYCCYLWRVSYVCSLSCQWDLHINKKRTSKRELHTRIRIKYFSSKIIFSFSLNSRCRLTFVWNFHRKFFILPSVLPVSCKAIRLQPDYTLNAAPLSPHTPSTHLQICVCVCVWDIQIYKLCNFMVLRRWMCKNIILHTSMPEAWKCTVYILACLPRPLLQAEGGEWSAL